MEKMLWSAIVIVWSCLVCSSAFGAEKAQPEPASDSVVMPSSAVPLVTRVRGPAVDLVLRPTLEPGTHGGAEIAGALVVVGYLAYANRRRRIL